jgi:hypothetical protein
MPGVSDAKQLIPRRDELDLVTYITLIFQAVDFFKTHYSRMTDETRQLVITNIRLHVRHLYDIHFS